MHTFYVKVTQGNAPRRIHKGWCSVLTIW